MVIAAPAGYVLPVMSENDSDDAQQGPKSIPFDESPTDPDAAARSDAAPSSGTSGAETASAPVDPVAQAKAEAAELKDKYLRLAADYDNYRKRARKDVDEAERRARESLLKDLLPVFDNLERAATHATQSTDVKAVGDGVRMVLKQFLDTLERVGIKRVDTTGAAFDPNVHEAIQQLESTEHPPGTVVAEVQAGYAMGERLVRAAMVVVAKAPAN